MIDHACQGRLRQWPWMPRDDSMSFSLLFAAGRPFSTKSIAASVRRTRLRKRFMQMMEFHNRRNFCFRVFWPTPNIEWRSLILLKRAKLRMWLIYAITNSITSQNAHKSSTMIFASARHNTIIFLGIADKKPAISCCFGLGSLKELGEVSTTWQWTLYVELAQKREELEGAEGYIRVFPIFAKVPEYYSCKLQNGLVTLSSASECDLILNPFSITALSYPNFASISMPLSKPKAAEKPWFITLANTFLNRSCNHCAIT